MKNKGHVRSGLDPNVERRDIGSNTIGCMVATWASLQEVLLKTGKQADKGSILPYKYNAGELHNVVR